VCGAIRGFLDAATPLLAPADATLLEPLRAQLTEYEAGTA